MTIVSIALGWLVAGRRQAVADTDGAGEHPDVGDLFPGRAAIDLEDGAGGRGAGVAVGGGEELGEAGQQRADPGTGDRHSFLEPLSPDGGPDPASMVLGRGLVRR